MSLTATRLSIVAEARVAVRGAGGGPTSTSASPLAAAGSAQMLISLAPLPDRTSRLPQSRPMARFAANGTDRGVRDASAGWRIVRRRTADGQRAASAASTATRLNQA